MTIENIPQYGVHINRTDCFLLVAMFSTNNAIKYVRIILQRKTEKRYKCEIHLGTEFETLLMLITR